MPDGHSRSVQVDVSTDEEPENLDPDNGKTENDILDEMTGQMKLF